MIFSRQDKCERLIYLFIVFMTRNFHQGIFNPKHPEKYAGNFKNIIYRSSWELKFFHYLDNREDVIYWSSEELAIPYFNPIDQKIHRYFPDIIFKVKTTDGNESVFMVEIKPYKQTLEPIKKRNTKTFITESVTYAINQSKWKAADKFCSERGWTFKIITEKDLNF